MFFGSLWFSWQIEAANIRNVVPYLPFLAVMVAVGCTFWIGLQQNSQRLSHPGDVQ
jgi:hypothetical protein